MRAIYDYIMYTDGGCECNPGGRGGYGAVIINNNTGEFTDISGGFRSTTNNRMEVMAVIKALEKIKKDTHVQLFSDSQYVIKTMNGMFRKKKNIDLWKKLDKLAVAFEIEWNWVKGHNGNTYNEKCDTFCQEAMTLPELEEDEGYMNTDSVPEQSDTVAQSLEKYNMYPDCSDVESYQEKYLVNPICAKLICQFYKQNRKKFQDYVDLRTDGTDFWSRKKKDTIMDIKEYSTDIWDIIVDHFAETKYQMMCIRWCARGLALGDAIKKVQVDMEVAENCLANKKRNMQGWKRNRLLREMSERIFKYQELKKVIKNKNSPISLGCVMNCKIHVTSVVGGETVSPTDRK